MVAYTAAHWKVGRPAYSSLDPATRLDPAMAIFSVTHICPAEELSNSSSWSPRFYLDGFVSKKLVYWTAR